MKKLLVILALLAGLAIAMPGALAYTFTAPAMVLNEDGSNATDLDNAVTGLQSDEQIVNFKVVTQGTKTTSSIASATNVLTVTGKANANGADSVALEVTVKNTTDQTTSTAQSTSSLTITPVNDLPVFNPPAQLKARSGAAFTHQFSATDVDNDPIEFFFDSMGWAIFQMSISGYVSFTPTDADIGLHTVTVSAEDSTTSRTTKEIDVLVGEASDDGSLIISGVDIEDSTGKDDELNPGDLLKVDFELENKLTVPVDSIEVEAWLQDETGKKLTDKMDLGSVDLEDKDSQTMDFEINTPFDAKDAEDVILVIEAVGEEDVTNAEKSVVFMQRLAVQREDHDVAFESITVSPEIAACGSSVDVAMDVWNVGSDTENVKLRVKNSDLKIDSTVSSFELKKSGSSANALQTVSVDVPANTRPGNYTLTVTATYNKDKTSESASTRFEVLCSSFMPTDNQGTDPGATGTGALTLESSSVEAKQGEQTKITATLRNTGNVAAVYTLEMTGLSGWATGYVEPDTVTLAPGASSEVFVYITPKTSATGDQSATLSVKSNNAVIETERITLELPDRPGFSISPLGSGNADDTAAVLIIISIIAVAALLIAGRRIAEGGGIQIYGKKKK